MTFPSPHSALSANSLSATRGQRLSLIALNETRVGASFVSGERWNEHFLSNYLSVSKLCYNFAAVNKLATTYQQHHNVQRILRFFASFCVDYLVNPNNLLTHTHTHTHTHLTHLTSKRLRVRAREERATPINKGLKRVPFVRFFVSLYEQKMNEITLQNIVKNNPCVPIYRR